MRQTGYLPRPPTYMKHPEILCAGTIHEVEYHENRLRGLVAVGSKIAMLH